MQGKSEVPFLTKLAYGTVNTPLSFIGFPLVIYVAPFYSGELGLPLALVGTMLFIARITDVITDPIVGILSDKVQTRFGRRKIWLATGTAVMVLGVYMLFIPDPPVTVWYLLLWVSVVYLGFTMIALPHEAWGGELSPHYHERTQITGTRQTFGLIGLVLATVVPAVIISQGGKSGAVLEALGWTVLATLPLSVMVVCWFVPEKPNAPGEVHVPFWRGLQLMTRNGPFKRILLVLFIAVIGETFRITITYFFAMQVIGIANLGTLYLWYFVTGLLAIPVWIKLGHRIGKHRALGVSFTIIILSSAGMYLLGKGDTLAFTVLFAMKGFCFGSLQLLPSAMVADVVDVDTLRSGQKRQGLFYAVAGVVLKLGMALGQGLSLNLLDLTGFSAAGSNGADQLWWLSFFYCVAPCAFFLVALRLVWKYPLTAARHRRIQDRLRQRAGDSAGAAPAARIEADGVGVPGAPPLRAEPI